MQKEVLNAQKVILMKTCFSSYSDENLFKHADIHTETTLK